MDGWELRTGTFFEAAGSRRGLHNNLGCTAFPWRMFPTPVSPCPTPVHERQSWPGSSRSPDGFSRIWSCTPCLCLVSKQLPSSSSEGSYQYPKCRRSLGRFKSSSSRRYSPGHTKSHGQASFVFLHPQSTASYHYHLGCEGGPADQLSRLTTAHRSDSGSNGLLGRVFVVLIRVFMKEGEAPTDIDAKTSCDYQA